MKRYILNRILLALVTVVGVSIIVFVAARLSGDVTYLLAPTNATEEQLQAIRVHYGLDKPILVQYLVFVKTALQGDFGTSIFYNQSAMKMVLERLPATLELGLLSFLVGTILGVLLGVLTAVRRGVWWIERGGKAFTLLGQAMPNFWLAVMLVLVFAVDLHWLPSSDIGGVRHLILPVISLSWFSMAFIMRITRSALLDVLDSDYIKMARIKGHLESTVIWKYAFRNALIPVVTMSGLQLANIIGGTAIIETIFRWPGVGALMVSSINSHDYPLIQAITIIASVFVTFVNLLIDLLFVVIDPRIKYV